MHFNIQLCKSTFGSEIHHEVMEKGIIFQAVFGLERNSLLSSAVQLKATDEVLTETLSLFRNNSMGFFSAFRRLQPSVFRKMEYTLIPEDIEEFSRAFRELKEGEHKEIRFGFTILTDLKNVHTNFFIVVPDEFGESDVLLDSSGFRPFYHNGEDK